jgi:hypothetical protein
MDALESSQNYSFDFNLVKLNTSEDTFHLIDSIGFLVYARKLNIIITLFVILIGLVGNSLTIYIFSHKKIRSNSSHIYLLCLSLIDSLFLINHFFDDTFKAYVSIYLNENSNDENNFLSKLFKHESICGLFTFFRYTLGFISSYTLTAFTVQRVSIVFKPLSIRYKTKLSAWKSFIIITILSIFLNIWVLCMFKIQKNQQDIQFCEINKDFRVEYFRFNGIYIFFIMFLPLFIMLICNFCIIYKTAKDDKNRKLLQQISKNNLKLENKEPKIKRTFASMNIVGLVESNNNLNLPKSTVSTSNCSSVSSDRSSLSNKLNETDQHLKLLDPKSNQSFLTIKSDPSLKETSLLNKSISTGQNLDLLGAKKSLDSSKSAFHLAKKSITQSTNSNNFYNEKRKPSNNTMKANSKKVTKSLMLISISYVLLNLPFLITCFLYFYEVAHNKLETISKNYLFSAFKISEVFYVFNFSIKFYIYCLTGPMLLLIEKKKKQNKFFKVNYK